MAVVYLTTAGSSVRTRGQRLEVWKSKSKLGDIRMFDLERLVVVGPVQFSTQALHLLLEAGTDVSFLTTRGRIRGALVSDRSRNVYLRLAQFDRWKDPAFRLAFAREVVTAKLNAQQRLLVRYERNHPDKLDPLAKGRLADLIDKVPNAADIETLMGLEGAGAAAYYGQFGLMLRNIPFPGRKKHPSTDPANSLLSFGYVLLGNELAAAVEAAGFDPAIGFFHGIRYGRQSLSLDLVEAFRQPLIDRLTLRLLNLGQFTPADFEGGERGLLLQPESLKRYLALYEEQLRQESAGEGTPTWRKLLRDEIDRLREMVLSNQVRPLYTWDG